MSATITQFEVPESSKVLFDLIDCATVFIKTNVTTFSNVKTNGCFEALFITAIVLIIFSVVQFIFILGLLICLANLKNKIDEHDYYESKMIKKQNIEPKVKQQTISSSSSSSSSSQSSSSESGNERKKKRRQQTVELKSIKTEAVNNTLKLPRYTVYRPNIATEEIVIEKNETREQEAKTHKSRKQKEYYSDEISLEEIKKDRKTKRSASRGSKHSHHSRHSSVHSHHHRKPRETRH